eukprot:CAMPEP_0185725324 /NCGR_PEP_ID=MMETSP1171-20130828/1613_1 /TAXON_ID=374046 /ORGANISM="Helicotheca tamensis, Strain CCMP826" /LENGTH=93 /DNA_ID=CAMNT_0028393427 /DNA_START=183 /DNA_END=464 /DNA_ORIENTATION=+
MAEHDYYHNSVAGRYTQHDLDLFNVAGAEIEEELNMQAEIDAEESYERALMDELDAFLQDEQMMALMKASSQKRPAAASLNVPSRGGLRQRKQ